MVYNEKEIVKLGESIAKDNMAEVKEVSINGGHSWIKLSDGRSVSVFSHLDNVEGISIYGKDSDNSLNYDITFHRFALIKKTRPFYIVSRESDVLDGLHYEKMSHLSLLNPNYSYSANLNGTNGPSYRASKVAYMNFESKKNSNRSCGKYSECFKTSGVIAHTNEKSMEIAPLLKSEEALNEISIFIRNLKKEYKDRECEIDDVLRSILLLRKMDAMMKNSFEELVTLNGTKELLKRK